MKSPNVSAKAIRTLSIPLLFAICTASLGATTNWTQAVIGKGDSDMLSVVVGNARNDGVQRVYGLTYDETLFEFEHLGATWNTNSYQNMSFFRNKLTIANCRNDGVLRLLAIYGDYVSEATYSGSAFSVINMSLQMEFANDVAVGQGRNDSLNRIYVASQDISTGPGWVQELTYKLTAYSLTNIYSATAGFTAIGVGNGRNDGINRVYAANANGDLLELSWSGNQWTNQALNLAQSANKIRIGDGRNDLSQHVYAATANGHVYELSYRAGTWDIVDVGYGGMEMLDLALGAGRGDGIQRVYAANADKHIYEFSCSSGVWKKQDVGAGTDRMSGVAVGAGRNDGVGRVYGANWDNFVYEFSYSPPSTNLPPQFIAFANGVVTWTNTTTNVVCDIEWCPNLGTGIWKSDWSVQSGILVTNRVMSVEVPMFYRIKVRNE